MYQWNDARLAESYVRALWWVLALVSVRGSIRYVVVPGLRRDDVLADPGLLEAIAPKDDRAWWRLTERRRGGDDRSSCQVRASGAGAT